MWGFGYEKDVEYFCVVVRGICCKLEDDLVLFLMLRNEFGIGYCFL